MSEEQQYKRDPTGIRLQMGGINTVAPLDALPPGKLAYAQNVRAYLQGRTTGRATQGSALVTMGAGPVHSLRRLNDTTPLGPMSGYALVGGASTNLYLNGTAVADGLSGNPISLLPFRPNASPQPWEYVADSSTAVSILADSFNCFGMLKVRSDGLTRKMGIEEPQNAPAVSFSSAIVNGSVLVPATTLPWRQTGTNPANYPFTVTGGTGPVVIAVNAGATILLSAAGLIVTSYSASAAPGDLGPDGSGSPGFNVPGSFCNVLMGAFTDSSGNVITPTTGSGPVTVGNGPTTFLVPTGATQLQLGVDDTAYGSNTGDFTVTYTLTTQAVTSAVSLLGTVTAWYWGDSPHSGQIASYIWKNPSDSGPGISRTVSTATGSTTNNSLIFDNPTLGGGSVPMQWTTLDSTGDVVGTQPVFSTPLEPEGFQDFNMCVTGVLYVPAAGTYTFTITSKDNVMWGIGGGATWSGKGTLLGAAQQTITVVNKSDLLPSPPINSEGGATTISVAVTFGAAGDYPIELDYDYWDKSGRTLLVTCNGATIVPLTTAILQNTQYRYTYRASETGATSNPSPESPVNSNPVLVSTLTPTPSTDPQVDKIDYYRIDSVLDNYTYVGTGPNSASPPFVDELSDLAVADNPLLQFDNFEPFPSIDLPKSGVVNVIGGVVEWVSGDTFNTRWLPGTIINIGGFPYTFYNRPSNSTTLLVVDPVDGLALVYEIAEPILAAQPMPSMWGETDNAAYAFACGDPLRPGTLYWSKGNNLDSAPDTNQQDVTSPSEALINGCLANGIGMVFSAENGWIMYPNFYQALATIQGVSGSAFTLIRSSVTRGLYIRPCICTDGSGTFFYRSKDGIERSEAGGPQKSVTDDDLYNIFPHEGFVPVAVTIAGFSIVPPDDTLPELQRLSFSTGYLYYDYQGIDSQRHTIVLDVAGNGWVVDVYQHPATVHALAEGPNANTTYIGCSDGTVHAMEDNGGETGSCVVLTPAVDMGDARANKTLGDLFIRANVDTSVVNIVPYTNQYVDALTGFSPATLAVNGVLMPYIIDFTNGVGRDVNDIEVAFVWPVGSGTYLDLWQPDWTPLPENTQDRPTDWTDMGALGPSFVQGVTLEANTFGSAKGIVVQSDDLVSHVPDQSPLTFNGQSKQTLTFTPPFVAYMVRIVTTDGVPWRLWPTPASAWTKLPFPASVIEWQTQLSSLGGKGWQHLREVNVAYSSTSTLTLTITFGAEAVPSSLVISVPSSGGLQTKLKIPIPVNKFKLIAFRLSSFQPFRVWSEDFEAKIGVWGRDGAYRNIPVIGGESSPGATL